MEQVYIFIGNFVFFLIAFSIFAFVSWKLIIVVGKRITQGLALWEISKAVDLYEKQKKNKGKDTLECGHHISLAAHSAETGNFLYCELCDMTEQRNDAVNCSVEMASRLGLMATRETEITDKAIEKFNLDNPLLKADIEDPKRDSSNAMQLRKMFVLGAFFGETAGLDSQRYRYLRQRLYFNRNDWKLEFFLGPFEMNNISPIELMEHKIDHEMDLENKQYTEN